MRRFPLALMLLLPVIASPQEVNVGANGVGGSHKALKVPLNGVVRLSLPSGQVALIQFTSIGDRSAEYRWRYKRAPGGQESSGSGNVAERYQSVPATDPHSPLVESAAGHKAIVRAGELLADWSVGGERYCYFYFDSKLARAKVLSAAAFGRRL
jgi:hypothetical protein